MMRYRVPFLICAVLAALWSGRSVSATTSNSTIASIGNMKSLPWGSASIDSATFGPTVVINKAHFEPLFVPDSNAFTVTGWAVDRNKHTTASQVFVAVDDRQNFPAKYGLSRPDVTQFLQSSNYQKSGFTVSWPAGKFRPGTHFLRVRIVGADHKTRYYANQLVPFLVYKSLPRLSNLKNLGNTASGSIDALNYGTTIKRLNPQSGVVPVPANKALSIVGWAVDGHHGLPAGGVYISVDGKWNIHTAYGVKRSDVGKGLHNPKFVYVGYGVTLGRGTFSPGRHYLRLKILSEDRLGYYVDKQQRLIDVK